jgi:hypothetical protein
MHKPSGQTNQAVSSPTDDHTSLCKPLGHVVLTDCTITMTRQPLRLSGPLKLERTDELDSLGDDHLRCGGRRVSVSGCLIGSAETNKPHCRHGLSFPGGTSSTSLRSTTGQVREISKGLLEAHLEDRFAKVPFEQETFDRSAAAFNNPDHVSIVVHNSRPKSSPLQFLGSRNRNARPSGSSAAHFQFPPDSVQVGSAVMPLYYCLNVRPGGKICPMSGTS